MSNPWLLNMNNLTETKPNYYRGDISTGNIVKLNKKICVHGIWLFSTVAIGEIILFLMRKGNFLKENIIKSNLKGNSLMGDLLEVESSGFGTANTLWDFFKSVNLGITIPNKNP